MTPLRSALVDYLAVRRALGYKLDREGKVLDRFFTYLEERGAQTITVEHSGRSAVPVRADNQRGIHTRQNESADQQDDHAAGWRGRNR